MKFVKLLFLFVFIITLAGCLDNSTDPEIITEPSTRSNYYIVNQTAIDLNVTYNIAFLDKDSTVAVLADSTTKIFESGGIGSSPPPSSALEELSFFELSDNTKSPLLTIQPIVNENWKATGENEATRFELVITNQDLN